MSILRTTTGSVNPMPIDTTRLRRDVAFNRAAQLLADAVLVRRGAAPVRLPVMEPIEREWFKQTARQLIELFELETSGKRPDAELVETEARASRALQQQITQRETQLAIARQRGRLDAETRGHVLGTFAFDPARLVETAACERCGRTVVIDLGGDGGLRPAGVALTEGCLTAAASRQRPFVLGGVA